MTARKGLLVVASVLASLAAGGAFVAAHAEVGAEVVPGVSGGDTVASTATGGEVLYMRYCASCHGATGHGDGPVASQLRRKPPDLTLLARRNGGRFDERRLVAVVDGRRAVAAHGSRSMPVWGDVFDAELEGEPHAKRQNLLRSSTLVDWLRSIQQR